MLHHGKTPCLKDMMEAYATTGGNLVAVAPVPDDQIGELGILVVKTRDVVGLRLRPSIATGGRAAPFVPQRRGRSIDLGA